MNKYDFTKKAILCETWEQMERLAEIAEKQGHKSWNFNKDDFYRKSMQYFGLTKSYPWYTNFSTASVMSDDIVITYADFMKGGEVETVDAAASNMFPLYTVEEKPSWLDVALINKHQLDRQAAFKEGASWQKHQQPQINTVKVVSYQTCPKCNGQGTVSKPPYVAGDVTQWSSTSAIHLCDVCNGSKLIPQMPIEQPQIDWDKLEVLLMDIWNFMDKEYPKQSHGIKSKISEYINDNKPKKFQ